MGTLLSFLSSIGIISSGAGTTASTTAMIKNTVTLDIMKSIIPLSSKIWDCTIWEVIFYEGQYDITNPIILSREIITIEETLAAETTVEGGIFAGSLGTAAETLGVSLAIGAAIYGGYCAYQHWDSVKNFASESLKTAEHYVSSATDYLKSWWPF